MPLFCDLDSKAEEVGRAALRLSRLREGEVQSFILAWYSKELVRYSKELVRYSKELKDERSCESELPMDNPRARRRGRGGCSSAMADVA